MSSELSDLVDLLTQRGTPTASIRIEIVKAVKDAFSIWTHQSNDQDIDVFIDYYAGNIAIHKSGKDITPPEFKEIAISTARKTLVKMLSSTQNIDSTNLNYEKRPVFLKWLFNFVFWFYNGAYVLFAAIFIFAVIKNDQASDVVDVLSDLNYFQTFILSILLITPLLTILFAVNKKRFRSVRKLVKIFFFFEIPLVVTSLLVFSSFGQSIPAIALIATIVILTPFIWLAQILNIHSENKKIVLAEIILKTLVLSTSLYIGLIVAFYIPLLLAMLGKVLLEAASEVIDSMVSVNGIIQLIPFSFALLFGSILVISIAAFVLLPYIIAAITWRSIGNSSNILKDTYTKKALLTINLVTVTVFLLVLFLSSSQTQNIALLNSIQNIKNKTTFEDRQAVAKILIPQKEAVAQSIKDAQSSQNRYPYTKEDERLKSEYKRAFDTENVIFDLIQETFNVVAYPIIYQGPKIGYFDLSDLNFEYVFGTNINPYKYTEPKTVTLNSRKVKVEPFADNLFATVTIEEEYQNTSFLNQEIIYEFSLSPDSVVTGLKLGPNLEYDGIVAPRGAALQTYQRELQRQRDPALLEETGPRQYRLRVFPIPSKNDITTLQGRNQKVQFSYITALNYVGYSLPSYTKEQNINITSNTMFEGTIDQSNYNLEKTTTAVPVANAIQSICESADDLVITSASVSATLVRSSFICNPRAQNTAKTAILYDVSALRNGTDQYKEIQSSLDQFLKNVDIYYVNDLLSQPVSYSAQTKLPEPVYFGSTPGIESVKKLQNEYENVIIMTSKGFVFDSSSESELNSEQGSVYIVYDQGKIPALQQNIARKLLQSKVSLHSSLSEAILQIDNNNRAKPDGQNTYFISPNWRLVATLPNNQKLQSDPKLQQFLAKKIIDFTISNSNGPFESNLAKAQPLHEISEQYKVVTLISSMIALVNDQQKQNLAYDSEKFDKFSQGVTTENAPRLTLPPNVSFGIGSDPVSSMSSRGSMGASYGFSNVGSSVTSILNLFVFANLVMLVVAGFAAAIYFYRQRRRRKS